MSRWNPRDALSFTFSSGDKTAERANGPNNSHYGLRGLHGKSSGKWYWEGLCTGSGSSQQVMFGVALASVTLDGFWTASTGYGYYGNNGNKFNDGSSSSFGSTYGNGNVVQVALDMDAKKLWFGKDGTYPASGDPAAGTNPAYTGLTSGTFFPIASCYYLTQAWTLKTRPSELSHSAPSGFSLLAYPATVTLTVKDESGATINSTAFKWAFFEQVSPDVLATPVATGTTSTNGSGVLTISIPETTLANGATGSLLISTTGGTAGTQCRSWYMPVTVSV